MLYKCNTVKIWVKSDVLNNGWTKYFLTNNLNLPVYIYYTGATKCINCMLIFISSYKVTLFISMNFVRIIDVKIATKYV